VPRTSNSSIRRIHFMLRAASDRAARWNYIGFNAAALAEPPVAVGTVSRALGLLRNAGIVEVRRGRRAKVATHVPARTDSLHRLEDSSTNRTGPR
jgi:hypothetical protein